MHDRRFSLWDMPDHPLHADMVCGRLFIEVQIAACPRRFAERRALRGSRWTPSSSFTTLRTGHVTNTPGTRPRCGPRRQHCMSPILP